MAAGNLVGSWFPSGYYGHYRSKSRNDYHCEYRRLARPQPPSKFIKRAKVGICDMVAPRKHIFSHHDNRQSFLTDALIFEEGLGRRRCQTTTFKSKPDLIRWTTEHAPHNFGETTYRDTYHSGVKIPPLLINRPSTSYDTNVTTYRNAYGDTSLHDQTYRRCVTSQNKIRTISTTPPGRNDVASCMIWYTGNAGNSGNCVSKMRAPAATATTNFSVIDLNMKNNSHNVPNVQVTTE